MLKFLKKNKLFIIALIIVLSLNIFVFCYNITPLELEPVNNIANNNVFTGPNYISEADKVIMEYCSDRYDDNFKVDDKNN